MHYLLNFGQAQSARPQNIKVRITVMPAWMAGIQARRMRPETSLSTWVPAVHAGTTSLAMFHVTRTNLLAMVLNPIFKEDANDSDN